MPNYAKLIRDPLPDSLECLELRRRMDQFYASTKEYTAFSDTPSDQRGFHELMLPLLEKLSVSGRKIRVLELGAGKPSFPRNIGALRERVEYHVQDVTPINQSYLAQVADQVFIGDIGTITGSYDLIFSTFVLEHVASPRSFLESIARLLHPGGYHVVICPRYDMPGYICPSLRHLPRWAGLLTSAMLTFSRLCTALGGAPRFFVNTDPALFHGPWFRDADAVHLVSRFDVVRWHRQNGFTTQWLHASFHGLRERILMNHLILSLACQKNP